MGDIAWARKYRPRNIQEYMGPTLQRVITNRFKDITNIPHTIMLYGTRGCGKTTGARLLCKEMLCLTPVDGHSCGECETCLEVDTYITNSEAGMECSGIVEINAADSTGKDAITEIIDDAMIEPMYPIRYKIVIMDECHKLSDAAQNSLLKLIEEPPQHLVFIFCTTDPEKVIPTIRSRMQLLVEVKKQTVDDMANRLMYVAQQEGLETSLAALKIIAKTCDRIPRDCLNKIEDVAKNYGNKVTLDTVRESTGDIASEVYMNYIIAANKSLANIAQFTHTLKELDITVKSFVKGLTRFILDSIYIIHGINLEDYPLSYVKQVKELFKIYKSNDFDMLLQIVEYANKMIDDDDTKAELILTTTALRIGKVQLLANGDLSLESSDASKENTISIINAQKSLNEELQRKIEHVPTQRATSVMLASVFGNTLAEVIDVDVQLNGVQPSLGGPSMADKTPTTPGMLSVEELSKLLKKKD